MSSAADLVVRASTVRTMVPDAAPATAVAVREGVVVAVGDETDVRPHVGTSTEVVDLGAATLFPGLVDGHFHPVEGLDLAVGVDLTAVTSLPEFIAALRAAPVDQGWVRGWGLVTNAFGDEPVNHAPIVEALGSDLRACIVMFDGHSAIASPAALAFAGISGPREFDGNSTIVCDENGTPTGHLLELEAMAVMEGVLPVESAESRRRRLRELLQSMAAVGITAGNAMDFRTDSGELVAALEDDGDLPLRLRFAPICLPGEGRERLDHIIDLQRRRGRRWRVDGVKFFIDGTIEGGTAWLEEPDSRGEGTQAFWPDPAEYRNAVRYLAGNGVPTVTHAIGDAGIRYALETLGGVATPPSGVLHRIEHIETLPADLVGEFARHGVVASMQPTHCTHYSRADQSDVWSARLGPERARRGYRTRDLREAGALLALGSDWPIAPFDPRMTIADAQLRRRAGHPDEEPIHPEQSLTAQMALEGYTTHAAAADGALDNAGRIAPGFRADLTAFALDPLVAPPDELIDAPVAATVVAGELVHVGGDVC